jgi:hypothetical protein
MADGSTMEIMGGDAYEVPPGHDGWVVGDEPWISIDSEGRRYFAKLDEATDRRTLATILLTDIVSSTELVAQLGLPAEETARWGDISRRMYLHFHDDGIISQFEGYEKLRELDWEHYRRRYGNIQRLELILEAEHDSAAAELDTGLRHHATHLLALDQQVGDFLLEQRQVRLVLQHRADRLLVQHAVGLRARRTHRGTLARIQGAELDAAAIGRLRHRTAERVDLLDQVTLADAADGGVAAHLPERLDALRQQQRAHAHARRGQRGLGAGMAAAYNDDVEFLGKAHGKARLRGAYSSL